MKYFIEGTDDNQWEQNMISYWKLFDTVSADLPKRVVKTFTSKYLHDSEIESITCFRDYSKKRNNQYNVIIKINNEEFAGEFVHYDVREFTTKFSMIGSFMYVSEYLYGEILKDGDYWTHNFLFSNAGEIFIKCKKIDWIKKE